MFFRKLLLIYIRTVNRAETENRYLKEGSRCRSTVYTLFKNVIKRRKSLAETSDLGIHNDEYVPSCLS